ncbi:mitochondrial ribosomal death-associated protein 3-domain-containing protein [Tricharina praecox]|uniref:mitochondrial ribosomal death-associated protein 3-domain-containing protein n=1 Tax=Tricharina praecox TaxID=43433 RepID=UPI00221F9581|nr:mitochondrial ribosomal death-associated protein 3-domain-containing protein [Tricharina praecox]KAI5847524.1 mitochondrial ribosomal death-associated protein 3-domain-containing protein [Tricharina praecox]
MVLSTAGWRCLRSTTIRQLPRSLVPTTPTAAVAFTTSAATLDKSSKPNVKGGQGRNVQTGQQRVGGRGGPPTTESKSRAAYKEGERKQIRQRIVLSNTNAPPVNLGELTVEVSIHEPTVGSVFALAPHDVDKLRELQAFRRTQDWKFFYRPSTVMRKESLVLGEMLKEIQEGEKGACERVILSGPKGSGKSVLLLQAMSWALQREWVVINISNAHDLVIGHTEYEHDATSGTWAQREYTRSLLSRILSANHAVLARMKLSKDHTLNRIDFPAATDLAQFCQRGSRDATISHEVFTTLLEELCHAGRPPVLFAVDSLNFMMQNSDYHDQDYNIIHAHDLAIPRHFCDFLNGTRAFPRGLVIGATSLAGAPRTDAFEYALRGWKLPAYSKLDTRIAPSIAGAEVMEIGAMAEEEAKSLLEYCRVSGLLKEGRPLSDEQVAQRVAVSSGLAKELVAGCVRMLA